MKKFFALMAVVLCFAACQKDVDGMNVNMGGDIAKISVVLPEDAITRAGGTDSAKGGLTNTSGEVVRVILQVYYQGVASQERLVAFLDEGELTAHFDVRLVPDRDYTFVAWADQVAAKEDVDLYFNTQDLKAVTCMTGTWEAMNESRDAYTATQLVENFNSSKNITLTLTRPFAKLRIKTTDMVALNNIDIMPTTATIAYSTKHYNAFDAFAGMAVTREVEGVEHEFEIASYGETGAEKTLFTDYFFAAGDEEVVNFTFEVFDQNGAPIKANAFTTDIPVKRNHLTTIAGNILTNGNNITVTIDERFDGENDFTVKTVEELKAALNVPGAKITLENDLTIDKKLTISNDVTINGNNKTLTYTGGDRAIDSPKENNTNVTITDLTVYCSANFCERGINFNNAGTLTLDNVKVYGKNINYALCFPSSSNNATVEITNSEILGNTALNFWGADATVNVTDTTLKSEYESDVETCSTVKLNNNGTSKAEGTVINIVGGEVTAKVVAVSNATSTGEINISDTTVVNGAIRTDVAAIIYEDTTNFYTETTLQGAINKASETNAVKVILLRDIELEEAITVTKDQTVTIDLGGHNVHMVDATEGGFEMIKNQGNLTIEGEGTLSVEATINSGWSRRSAVISNTVGGNLTVKAEVVVEHLGGTDMAYGIDNLTNDKGTYAVTIVEGATIKSTYSAIRQFLNGIEATNELYVKDGTKLISPNRAVFFHDPSKNANTGKLVVEAGAEVTGNVHLSVTKDSTEWPVEVCVANAALVGESKVTSSNVPNGYEVVLDENNNWVVNSLYRPIIDKEGNIVSGLYVDATDENTILVKDIKDVAKKATDGLAWIAANVGVYEGFAGKTIKLLEDIDLNLGKNGEDAICFDPIGSYRFDESFMGVFDGQNHTISNMSQNTWALDNGYYYNDCGLGLFGATEGATIKNLKMDNASISGESALCGVVAATAHNTTFENITVTNSDCADYQYYSGGIVGWASGECTFIKCNVDASTTVAAQWGDFDNSIGGVIGGASGSAKILMKDCTVACRIDAYNDVTSTYQWYAYRRCGMLIGNPGKTKEIDGTTYADAPQLTCENVTVIYGDWANYTYCEFAGTSWPYVRVQEGVSNSAYSNPRYGHPTDANGNEVVDGNHVHNEGEDHEILCVFDQLYGGGQGVYGTPTHDGVTVVYNNK